MNLTDQFVISLLEGSTDGICVAEIATGKVVYANPAAGQLMECDPSELIGKHQAEFVHGSEAADAAEKFRSFSNTDSYKEIPINVYTKTGKKKPVLISGSNMFTDGNIDYAVAYFKDLTSNKHLDEIIEEQAILFRKICSQIVRRSEQLIGSSGNGDSDQMSLIHEIRMEAEELDNRIKNVALKAAL
jgi:PAS domain S-box-containing protein